MMEMLTRTPDSRITIGDWVRFYEAGRIVIGEVRYIRTRTGGYVDLLTDVGSVSADMVLEMRRAESRTP